MTAEPTNSDADAPSPGDDKDAKPIPETRSPDFDQLAKLRQKRKDRIAQIKAEIEAGNYDSDELLDAALGRMLHNMPMDDGDDVAEEEES